MNTNLKILRDKREEIKHGEKHYTNIKQLIENNLVEVKKQEISTNYNTLITYYNVGKEIIEAQGGEARAQYGNQLIKDYSIKLTNECGKRYRARTLRNMRQFYLVFRDENIWRPPNYIGAILKRFYLLKTRTRETIIFFYKLVYRIFSLEILNINPIASI